MKTVAFYVDWCSPHRVYNDTVVTIMFKMMALLFKTGLGSVHHWFILVYFTTAIALGWKNAQK